LNVLFRVGARPRQLKRSAQQVPLIEMGFGIAILLTEKKLPTERYLAFVNACTSLLGEAVLNETEPLNLNAIDSVHWFSLGIGTHDRVWVSLDRREFAKKYGRSRCKFFWQIYLETKAGRDPESLALQFLIPLQAFDFFEDPVVLVELNPEKVFLERRNYATFAERHIALACGEHFVNNLALT
jgi:hypothetical protein